MIVAFENIDSDTKYFLLREGGLIEQLSAVGYFICIFFFLFQGKKRLETASFLLLNVFLLFLGLRELDFHSRFTTMGIFKTRFYVSPDVPFSEKIIGTVVILFLIFTAIYIFKRHSKDFLTGLVNNKFWSIGVFLGLALMVISKIVDSQADFVELVLARIGVEWNPMSVNVEEMMELAIPIMFLFAILSRYKSRASNSGYSLSR